MAKPQKAPRLKAIRQNVGLSIRQLAANSGVDRTKISRWERGTGLNMIRESIIVAKTLGTNVETLYGPER